MHIVVLFAHDIGLLDGFQLVHEFAGHLKQHSLLDDHHFFQFYAVGNCPFIEENVVVPESVQILGQEVGKELQLFELFVLTDDVTYLFELGLPNSGVVQIQVFLGLGQTTKILPVQTVLDEAFHPLFLLQLPTLRKLVEGLGLSLLQGKETSFCFEEGLYFTVDVLFDSFSFDEDLPFELNIALRIIKILEMVGLDATPYQLHLIGQKLVFEENQLDLFL